MKLLAAVAAALLSLAVPALAQPAAAPKAVQRVVLPTTATPERYDITIRPDAAKLAFEGEAKISLRVNRPTNRIVVNAADLTFKSASLSSVTAAPRIVLDDKEQTASFVFAQPLKPGRYVLSTAYSGKIYQQASGLFALDYEGKSGQQRALFTQFENSDARRFAPMWDEPGVKAIFSLKVEVPHGQMAISNMPVKTTSTAAGKDLVTFADSPKMSSYLLFLGVGDFERIHKQVGKTDVGVVVRRGDTAKGEFALDAAAKLLGYYNDYFGTPYPLPKLDLVAGPGQSQFFGAMENWGAIFYFDYYLLLDPKLSTEADKQQVFIVVAHEMAHQWFGDLVTMAWWDDLWLNEGFASWMENKATDHLHPEWKVWLQTQEGQQTAMRLDARTGTHPVITPIPDVFAAANAFDSITYQKGQAVIRMLEAYMGEDAFRAGIRKYIAKHAYGNAASEDLWTELSAATPKPVKDIAHDFTLQPGVPLIRATAAPGGVRLTQERFAADAASRKPLTWRVPVDVRSVGAKPAWQSVVSAAKPAVATTVAPAVVNAGQTGYFRTAYSPDLWAKLAPKVMQLEPADQLGLIFDSRALGETGYAPMTDFLALSRYIQPSADPVVLNTLAGQLTPWDYYYDDRAGQAAWRAFGRARLAPAFARVGWDAKKGEADNDALLRRTLIAALGQFDDPAVLAEAHKRFEASLTQPDSLSGSTRRAVLEIVATHADARTWEQIRKLAKDARDITDKSRLYALLGAARDPALADKALALALTDEAPVTDRPSIVAAVSEVHPDKAFAFALSNRDKLNEWIEPPSRATFYTRLGSGSRDPAMIPKLEAFAKTVPASSRGEIDKALSAIRFRVQVIQDRLPEVDKWLAANPG